MSFVPLHRPSVFRKAFAKVNLALAVGPPRPGDGFHPIASWMAPIDLADDLLITRLEDDRLSRYAILWHRQAPRTSPIDWSITKDLAVRAHLLIEEEAERPLPIQMKLEKRIPVGGGLGGGSSDAAAMMLALRELFELPIADARLAELASTLGSDVPYFLGQGPALVEGLGERIERTPEVTGHLVLLMPEFGCPTGKVYRAFDDTAPEELRADAVRRLAREARLAPDELFNDLAAPAERVSPALSELRTAAARAAARPVHITGSGSTMFVLCETPEQAGAVAGAIAEECGGLAMQVSRLATPAAGAWDGDENPVLGA